VRAGGQITTWMLRKLPPEVGRTLLVKRLAAEGFGDSYDLLYVPMNFKTGCNLGFAFVNFLSQDLALRFRRVMRRRSVNGDTTLFDAMVEASIQGFEANVARATCPRVRRVLNVEFQPLILWGRSGAHPHMAGPRGEKAPRGR